MEGNWLDYMSKQAFGDLHVRNDNASGLQSVIAIHDTTQGPALGGCRLRAYENLDEAITDATRLARGMTFKSVLAGLPLGGGKSVIVLPKGQYDRRRLFEAFGDFVQSLNGQYITAMDMATTVEDMDVIASRTSYVTCTSDTKVGPSDPSSLTALGVFKGMEAAVHVALNRTDLDGVHVAIQGVGHVGYHLCRLLKEAGARLTITDINTAALAGYAKEFDATVVSLDDIYTVKADVFSPCAIGGTINTNTIAALNVSVVAGCANNQLAEAVHGDLLAERGILYAPDYLINAGGIIQVAAQYMKESHEQAIARIENIYNTATEIFQAVAGTQQSTDRVAEKMAMTRLAATREGRV